MGNNIVFHLLRLAKKWVDFKTKAATEMNIDASHEFARFVKSAGVELTTDPAFCVKDEDHCAIIYSPPTNCVSLQFAVLLIVYIMIPICVMIILSFESESITG